MAFRSSTLFIEKQNSKMTKEPCDDHATSDIPHTKDSKIKITLMYVKDSIYGDSKVYTTNQHLRNLHL